MKFTVVNTDDLVLGTGGFSHSIYFLVTDCPPAVFPLLFSIWRLLHVAVFLQVVVCLQGLSRMENMSREMAL